MEKMTKKDKFKKFVYDHRETIAQVTVYTTLIVSAIAIIAKEKARQQANSDAVSDHNSWTKDENEWIDEQNAADKIVYLLHDWSYLLVPKDTEVEWVKNRNQSPLRPKN